MKKIILVVLIIASVISVSLCIMKYKDYQSKNNNDVNDKIDEVNNEITKIDEEILQKETELQNVKDQKKEEVELVESWKEKLNQIKGYMS